MRDTTVVIDYITSVVYNDLIGHVEFQKPHDDSTVEELMDTGHLINAEGIIIGDWWLEVYLNLELQKEIKIEKKEGKESNFANREKNIESNTIKKRG